MDDDCRRVLDELQVFLDAECGPDLEHVLRQHLRDCEPCLRRADFELALRTLIAQRCREPAPEALVTRVITSLNLTWGSA